MIKKLFFDLEYLKLEIKCTKKSKKLYLLLDKYTELQKKVKSLDEKSQKKIRELQGKRNKTDLKGDIIYPYMVIERAKSGWAVLHIPTNTTLIKTTKQLLYKKHQRKLEIGNKIGCLHITNGPIYVDKKDIWICKCDCGQTVYKRGSSLRSKPFVYCGKYCMDDPLVWEKTEKYYEKMYRKNPAYFSKIYKKAQKDKQLYKDFLIEKQKKFNFRFFV